MSAGHPASSDPTGEAGMAVPPAPDAADEVVHLRRALASRGEIAVAVGILAERHGCSPEQAWALLTRLSSHTNLKVRRIAQALQAPAGGPHTDEDAEVLRLVRPHLPPRRREAAGSPDELTADDG